MKNKIKIVLLWMVLGVAIMGCGSKTTVVDTDNKNKNIKEEKRKTEVKTDKEKKVKSFSEFSTKPTIQETTVVDKKDVKVVISNLRYNSYEAEIDVHIDNKSKKNIIVTAGTMGYSCNAVNHFMLGDGFLSVEVAKGQFLTDSITFDIKNMKIRGITKISDIHIGFYVMDEDYKEIYKGGKIIKTSDYEEYDAKKDSYLDMLKSKIIEEEFNCKVVKLKDKKIKLKDGVEIVSQALIESRGRKSVFIEIANTSDKYRHISINDIDINKNKAFSGALDAKSMMPKSRLVIEINIDQLLEGNEGGKVDKKEVEKISYVVKLHKDGFKEYYKSKINETYGGKNEKN